MKKQQDKVQVSLRLDRRLKTRVDEMIAKLHYRPTFTQVVEAELEKACNEVEGKKRGNG